MAGAAVEHLHVHVGARTLSEALEEILDELRLQVAAAPGVEPEIDDGVRAAAEIDRRDGERLVHGHHEIARAVDAPASPEGLRDGFAERNAHVLDGVVLVNVQIAVHLQRQVERAMSSEQLHHVIEKADTGRDLVASTTFDAELQPDRPLPAATVDPHPPHNTSSSAAIARRASSTIPAVMRSACSHPP